MRIDVHDAGHRFNDQTCAYAEYRVFSTLISLDNRVDHAIVMLSPAEPDAATSGAIACSVSIRLRSGREVDVVAHGQHPYDAIDSAARRIATALEPHIWPVH